ncbi:hypothetical protein MLD38_014369 [Melastoma candidum]|uniref:Uncharacterized protein n=1 Tax=Melastoma candidum TaxID=119954 RepID=A0ACB9RL00_9MYRT|nr:hypothetical protein MLD38_014369 [Melastoma candidum]
MAKFLVLIVTLACVVGSVQCCRPFWEIIWPPLLPPPPPPSLPSPSPNNKDGSFSPPPLPYDPHNPPISPSPSPYDNLGPTSQPPLSPSQPPLSPSRPPLPSSHVKPSDAPSSHDSGNKTKQLPQALAPSHVSDRTLLNVLHYGAKGNGRDDDSQAFKDAWDDACRSSSSSGIFVPAGPKYMLLPMSLSGPCNANITVQINGELVAPEEPSEWGCSVCHTWIEFEQVDGLTIQGSGSFNGQGAGWWRKSFCDDVGDIKDCHKKPTVIKAHNLSIRDLTFKDSPQMHIVIGHSRHVHIDNLVIRAPGNSPNTDGIHIQNCEHVQVSDSDIGTGDDCISISNGSSDVNVKGVLCGPGHGVSIGSLGKNGAEDKVENVHVKDVHFRGSTNGARIKTWQGGKGYAKNIIFEDITCDRVRNPIIITQFYCDHEICRTQASAVQISNVTFSNVKGSSYTEKAIELECSESHPCTDIILKDIDLRWTKRERETQSTCSNVQGRRNGNISPSVPCLAFDDKLGYKPLACITQDHFY